MSPDELRRACRWERPSLVAALLVIPYLLLDFVVEGQVGQRAADVLYFGLWGFFALEAVAMLRIAPNNRSWLRHNALDVAVLILTAPIPGLSPAMRVLWLLRVLDLLPLVHRHFMRVTVLRYGFIVWLLGLLGGAVAYATVEPGNQTLVDGLYWANTTISTVGYGDVTPASGCGKLVAMVMQMLGVVIVAIFVKGVSDLFDREYGEGFDET